MVKRYNIVRPDKYTVNGAEKTKWLQVGEIIVFDDGGMKLQLNHTSEKFMVFAQTPKNASNSSVSPQITQTPTPAPIYPTNEPQQENPPPPQDSDLQVSDIPF